MSFIQGSYNFTLIQDTPSFNQNSLKITKSSFSFDGSFDLLTDNVSFNNVEYSKERKSITLDFTFYFQNIPNYSLTISFDVPYFDNHKRNNSRSTGLITIPITHTIHDAEPGVDISNLIKTLTFCYHLEYNMNDNYTATFVLKSFI